MKKQPITTSEAATRLLNFAEHDNRERRLTVRIHSPGGIGGTPTVDVTGIHNGVGMDLNKIILHTDYPLTKLTPEQLDAVTESVRLGQSWHALEQYRELRGRMEGVERERDAMASTLRTIAERLGLEFPTNHTIGTFSTLVVEALNAQEMRYRLAETQENHAEIAPAPVERNERGLWRHPAFPLFLSAEDRRQWLKQRNLDAVGTYLVAPDDAAQPGDYSGYELAQPDGYFLLAIEVNATGPVAIWGRKIS